MRVGLAPDHFSPLPHAPAEPQILSPPYDIWNVTGQDVIFGCEVFAYPMASIEWRKDGAEMLLPGDDPHISVQVRGCGGGGARGPQRTPRLLASRRQGLDPGPYKGRV